MPFKNYFLIFKNITYLLRYDLKKINTTTVKRDELNQVLDGLSHEVYWDIKKINQPKIMSPKDTISELIQRRVSFCRFGDGEISLMVGEDIAFQRSNVELAQRLAEILSSDIEDVLIGLPHCWWSSLQDLRPLPKEFIRTWVAQRRDSIVRLINPDKQYYDSACTQLYAIYKNHELINYFEDVKKIWRDREIVIICGKTVFDRINTNIFECARKVEYQYAPSINAFDSYDEIFKQAKQIDIKKIIIIILGPTATVLAYDLAQIGYHALDFGHIAKDYDFFCKKIKHNKLSIQSFFKPD